LISVQRKGGLEGIIFTGVYRSKGRREGMAKIIDAVKQCGGQIYFVQLKCDRPEIIKRIKIPSRRLLGKVTDINEVEQHLQKIKFDVNETVSYKENLIIDNTKLSAKKVAGIIKEHYRL
jgi:Icc-related predicted phosphoesterase